VLGPADKPSTGQTAAEVMRRFDLKALFCPPNIYEQLLQEPDAIERAKKLKFLMYAGGPLTTATGTALSKVTDVCGFYGSTETSPVQALVPLREDWDTLEFHPLYGADFQPSDDDAYELVLHHDPKLEGVRGLDCNFRDIEEWRTKDLFRPHATKPNLWRFHGRTDDIIVLSNGEKLNPVPSEAIINSHPLVSAALIVGQGHFQAALLVEPVKTARSSSELIDELWPTIEKANAQAQSHGRIIRSMIAIAGPSKPFERAGKGTVVRRLTAEKFAGEIEALYSDLESGNLQGGPTLSDSKDAGSVQEFVSRAVAFSFPLEDIKPSDDLYVLGLDSLKTVEVVAVLKSGLGNQDTRWLSSRTLYGNPTIERLSRSLHSKLNTDQNGDSKIMDEVHEDINMMASLVHEYSKDLPGAKPATVSASVWSKCVVLTGSTGSLGKRLLRRLLASPHVTKVYCLDRNVNASSKHTDTLASEKNKSRVEFLQVEYGQPTFGLSAPKYEELLKSVDTIIHSAWKVNFNHSLESFEPVHIRGVRNLVDLQIRNPRKPRMIFISSISSVSRWPTLGDNKGPIPDNFIPNFDAAQIMGYGESKHVAEHILYEAGEITGVASTILRVGQIAGPLSSNGVWNEDEWVPALIKSSKALGCLPNGIPDVDWIPVDSLASIITELSLSAPPAVLEEKGASFFNLVNPHLTAWKTLLETLKEHLGPSTEVVPLEKWIKRLQDLDANDPKVIAQYPAVKILDFFESLSEQQKFGKVQYSTTKSCEASKTMASLPAVGSAAMKVWLKQWGY